MAEYRDRVSNMLATVPREERAEEPVVAKRAREKLELEWGRPSVAGAWTIGGSREEWRAFFDWLDARRPAEPARAKPPEKFSDLLARAMEEPSLEEARVFLAIAETDRIVRQLAGPVPYETTFKYMFAEVEKAWLLRAAGKAEPARAEEPKEAEVSERERELAETLAQAMSDWWNEENKATWQDRAERLLGRKAPQPTFAELKAERDQLRAELATIRCVLLSENVESVEALAVARNELRAELAKANERIAELTTANDELHIRAFCSGCGERLGSENRLGGGVMVAADDHACSRSRLEPPTDSAAKGDEKRFVNGDQVHRHYGATGGAGLANNPYVVTGLKAVSASLPTAEEDERIVDGMMAERANGRKETRLKQRASSLPTAGEPERDIAIMALIDVIERPHPGRAGEFLDALERMFRLG